MQQWSKGTGASCRGGTALILCAVMVSCLPATARATDDCTGTVATRQGITAFSSLIDGQPGAAGQPQLTLSSSAAAGTDQAQLSYGFTPSQRRFACGMFLSIVFPALEGDGDSVRVDRSIGFAWEQRWQADDDKAPTLSSLVSLQVPFDSAGSRSQLALTGVLARSFKAGTAYLNLSLASQGGIDSGDWQTTLLAGWRHDLPDGHSLVLDLGVQNDGDRFLEGAVQIAVGSQVLIGPGLSWSEDGGRGSTTVGVVIQRVFGARAFRP